MTFSMSIEDHKQNVAVAEEDKLYLINTDTLIYE